MQRRIAVIVVLVGATLLVAFHRAASAYARAGLLLLQELPQSPVKPLSALTAAPRHEALRLESPHGSIVADLLIPTRPFGGNEPGTHPALVLAMGVRTAERDRPVLMRFATTLARLDFVVLWPRLEALDAGGTLPEEATTFLVGVLHLQGMREVDRQRISVLGFSIGASTALVAASDPATADAFHAVVFFGGFYDIEDYFLSLATGTMVVDGRIEPWEPESDAVGHMRQLLEAKQMLALLRVFDAPTREAAEQELRAAPPQELAELRRFSPSGRLGGVQARLFVLHDRGDRFVPYVESIKLHREASKLQARVQAFLLTGLFQHAQFKEGVSWDTLQDIVSVYLFVVAALADLYP